MAAIFSSADGHAEPHGAVTLRPSRARRARIAISAGGSLQAYLPLALAVRSSGAVPVRWRSVADVEMAGIDGIVIAGGPDLAPSSFGGRTVAGRPHDHPRDALETWICQTAIAAGVPLLGFGRGCRVLNVALGGRLAEVDRTSASAVEVLPGTRLGECLGRSAGPSWRPVPRQAIVKLGDGLRIAARDASGRVQAIERIREPFAIGVEWIGPAHLLTPSYRPLVAALVAAIGTPGVAATAG